MVALLVVIAIIIGVYCARYILIRNGQIKPVFVMDMIINILIISLFHVFGLIIVAFFEYKHIKEVFHSGDPKDFVYKRYIKRR